MKIVDGVVTIGLILYIGFGSDNKSVVPEAIRLPMSGKELKGNDSG
jgi:hypothetical protein